MLTEATFHSRQQRREFQRRKVRLRHRRARWQREELRLRRDAEALEKLNAEKRAAQEALRKKLSEQAKVAARSGWSDRLASKITRFFRPQGRGS